MPNLPHGWRGLHLVIVHFPIILFLVAPFLVAVGVGLSAARKQLFLQLALGFMILGTAMTYAAIATGGLAMKAAGSTPAVTMALEEHRVLAETTCELFSVLTLGFAAILFVPRLLGHDLESWVSTALFTAFLVFYGTGAVLLVDTARKGDSLVDVLNGNKEATLILQHEGGR